MKVSTVRTKVHDFVPRKIIKKLQVKWNKKACSLWGKVKNKDFLLNMIYITLFHAIESVGFTALSKAISKWLPLSPHSVAHNVKKIRQWGARWAKHHIKTRTFKQRTRAAKHVLSPPPLKKVTMWLDSCDFPLARTHKMVLFHRSQNNYINSK